MHYLHQLSTYIESLEINYVLLIVFLFFIPRLLGSFGLPLGLGAFFMGIFASQYFTVFLTDQVINVFATLGISALFLYAGLEVNFYDLKKNFKHLISHLVISLVILIGLAYVIEFITGFNNKVSSLIALALLTPSTGFILDTLPSTGLTDEQKSWVKNMAIATEILALLLLLGFQSSSPTRLAISVFFLMILIIILPMLFHYVSKKVSIKSPGSDFSFLLLLAVVTGTITKKLGAYYLVGAFIVGFAVNYFEVFVAKKSKLHFEDTAKFFASFFMPFYFFKAGLSTDLAILNLESALLGVGIFMVLTPLKIILPVAQRKMISNESVESSLPIAISLLPTLVFGLVLIDLIKQTNVVPVEVIGGLIIYTILSTITPAYALKKLIKRQDLMQIVDTNNFLKHIHHENESNS